MAIVYNKKISNRKVKPRPRLYPESLSLLGIRKDSQRLSFEDLRQGYRKGLEDNPALSKKEIEESYSDLSEIVNMFEDYVDNIHDNFDAGVGFFLMGNNDNGKTTLASVMAREAYRQRYDVLVTTAEDIGYHSRNFDDPDSQQFMINLKRKYDFLIIDEVGKETEGKSKFNQTKLEEILKDRIEKYELPTVVITNLSPEDFRNRYGNSIYSVLSYLQPIIISYSLYFRKPRQIIRGRDKK